MTRIVIIILLIFLNVDSMIAHVVMNLKPHTPGLGYHQTWFLGSNDHRLLYNEHAEGAEVDDGLFVAIKEEGGHYNGYSYYEIKHPILGAIDGGPAHLPQNPDYLDFFNHRILSEGFDFRPPDGMFAIWRGELPFLPDKTVIPKGSKFFFWISGGGHFTLGTSVMQRMLQTVKTITVKSQAIPKDDYALWFENSSINKVTFIITDINE